MNTKGHYGTAELKRDFGTLTIGNALASYRIGEEKSQRARLVLDNCLVASIERKSHEENGYQNIVRVVAVAQSFLLFLLCCWCITLSLFGFVLSRSWVIG